MTAAPLPNPDTAAFLDLLFGEQAGWLCAGYIDGDPSIKKGQPGYEPMKEDWYAWPRQRSDALLWLALHDDQRHNTYVRQCLFSKQSGCEANALPSRIIWQDDVTDPHKVCSVLAETSADRYQALIRLDRPATTEERKRLATTWREESKDSEDDQNVSKDVVHHIRVPGGHNSKRHGWHPVTYAQQSERIYNADKLLARCGETHPPCSSGGVSKARAEQHQADAWGVLQDGAALLKSKRWQAIINGRPQLRQLLVERQRVIIYNKNGQADDSTSAQRAVFVQNLITAWSDKNPGHLPEPEIRAVAMFLKPMLGRGKTVEQYQVDIDCLIALYRPRNYRPVATHCVPGKAQPATVVALPASPPRPRGRHYRAEQTRAAQLDRLRAILRDLPTDAAGAIRLDTKAIGGELGKSPRQVRNYLADLIDQREIKYIARGTGRGLAIFLTDSFQTPKAAPAPTTDQPAQREIKSAREGVSDAPISPVEMPQTANDGTAPHGETRILGGGVFLQERAGAKISLDDAMSEALAYFDAGDARLNLARVKRYVADNYPGRWPDRAIEGVYHRQLKARAYSRQDVREAKKAAAMRSDALARKSRSLATQVAAVGHALRTGQKLPDVITFELNGKTYKARKPRQLTWRYLGFLQHQAGIYAAEEAKRAAQEEQRIAEQGYSLVEQAEMLDLVARKGASHGKVDRANAAHHAGTGRRRAGSGAPFQSALTAPHADQGEGGGNRTSPRPVQACAGEATTAGAALTFDQPPEPVEGTAAHLLSTLRARSAGGGHVAT